ncbi:MAG: hypothetical protein K8H87_07985 [Pseudorhodoplanes sp.]|nr:hypothetical protein [Pseudorhodoplanes sp.]
MTAYSDIQDQGVQAGLLLSSGMFANTPDVTQQVLESNADILGPITVSSGWPLMPIVGLPATNISPTHIFIDVIDSKKYTLARPIIVQLHDGDGDWIATWADGELSRSGDTPQAALSWLKISMVELFELFGREKKLGPLPRRQYRALGEVLVEKSHTKG